MRTKLVFLLCLLVFIIAGLIAGLSTFTIQQHIIVHATIEKVAVQFTSAKSWKNWHPFINKDTALIKINTYHKQQEIILPGNISYQVQTINPAAIAVEEDNQGKTTKWLLSALPYKDGTYTYLNYIKYINGFAWAKRKFAGSSVDDKMLQSLKSYVEDDSRNYGFIIKIVPVVDTLILTTTMQTAPDKIMSNIPVLYSRLQEYCKAHGIAATKNYYFLSTSVVSEKNVQLAAGLPVQKQVVHQQPSFEFLKLPSNGRLVMGMYSGQYAGKQQLYTAMDKYILDKRLKKVAQPLEQYRNTDTSFTADSNISMKLFYPVF